LQVPAGINHEQCATDAAIPTRNHGRQTSASLRDTYEAKNQFS
jgi:hypothetical protein